MVLDEKVEMVQKVEKTRKQLIIEKYAELKIALSTNFNDNLSHLLPDLETMDIIDLVYYFTLSFSLLSTDSIISTLLYQEQIDLTDDEFMKLINIIDPFVQWLKNLQ